MSYNGYPEHIPALINLCDLPIMWKTLDERGFHNTIFQILSPRQVYGMIKTVDFNNSQVELHLRCLLDANQQVKVLGEYEPKRIGSIVQHLSRHSYSAHEYILELLNDLQIDYIIDENSRTLYNDNVPRNFPKQKFKFLHWFFIGGILTFPRGLLWRFLFELKLKIKRKTIFDHCTE